MRIRNLRQKAKDVSIYNFDTFFVPDTKNVTLQTTSKIRKKLCVIRNSSVFFLIFTHLLMLALNHWEIKPFFEGHFVPSSRIRVDFWFVFCLDYFSFFVSLL